MEPSSHPAHAVLRHLKKYVHHACAMCKRWLSFLPAPIKKFVSKRPWKVAISIIIIALLTFGYIWITKEPQPEYITAEVTRGDLVQSVEAVGTITSERDLKLQFPISGVVGEVLVNEGDRAEAGDRLASLRANDLAANVNSSLANLQAAQADLREMREGTRPEDIAIAEAEVANKQAALYAAEEKLTASIQKRDVLKREAEISLAGDVATAGSTISQNVTTANISLGIIEDVLSDSSVQSAITPNKPGFEGLIREKIRTSEAAIIAFLSGNLVFKDYQEALDALRRARIYIADVNISVRDFFNLINNLPATSGFTRSERETRKSDLADEKSNLESALSDIDAAIKSLQDASANFDTKIATEESTIANAKADILTYETSLRTQEAQLALKRAGSRQTDIDVAAARVRQAQADLERSRADYADTILIAPVTGAITKVNIKTGELLSTAFQQDAAITMLGESPYRIEMYASEIDIPKIILSQSGAIELDAFPRRAFDLIVAEIDPAATDIDGVPKYRIKLDFLSGDDRFKIGMTGDVDIFTGERKDVLMMPARAVIENADGSKIVRILKRKRIEEVPVETGLEGETNVEVLSGVEEGDTVIVLIKK